MREAASTGSRAFSRSGRLQREHVPNGVRAGVQLKPYLALGGRLKLTLRAFAGRLAAHVHHRSVDLQTHVGFSRVEEQREALLGDDLAAVTRRPSSPQLASPALAVVGQRGDTDEQSEREGAKWQLRLEHYWVCSARVPLHSAAMLPAMPRRRRRSSILAVALGFAAAATPTVVACTTDSSGLKARDRSSTGGSPSSGGNAGSAGLAGSGGAAGGAGVGGSAGSLAGANAGGAAAGGTGPIEPIGDDVLRVVHGLIDSTRIAVCFRQEIGGELVLVGDPLTLDYGEAIGVPSSTLDTSVDVRPVVIAGDLAEIVGLDCELAVELAQLREAEAGPGVDAGVEAGVDAGDPSEAGAGDADSGADAALDANSDADSGFDAASDAGAPEPTTLRARELPLLPQGTLTGGRSTLLVVAGCVGGPAFTDPLERSVCGSAYAPDAPTLGVVLVGLSRLVAPETVALQFLNASVAAGPRDLKSVPLDGGTGKSIGIASSVGYGEVAPYPPKFNLSVAEYGVPLATSEVHISGPGSATPSLTAPWELILSRAGLVELSDGRGYTLLLLGPNPAFPQANWWNGPRVVILDNDP